MGRDAPYALSAGGKTGTAQTGRYDKMEKKSSLPGFAGFIPMMIRNTQYALQSTTGEKALTQRHHCLKKYVTACIICCNNKKYAFLNGTFMLYCFQF